MSTAGKVLVAIIILSTLGWVVLAAGVAQLERNGTAALAKQVAAREEAEKNLQETRRQVVEVRDKTTLYQEAMDRKLAVIRARQNDVQAASTRLKDMVARLQYQLTTIQETVHHAEVDRDRRTEEKELETKLLAAAQTEVQDLIAKDKELTDHLAGLRERFKSVFEENASKVASSRK